MNPEIRKVWKNSMGSKLITIPKWINLEPGDYVLFKEEDDKIILEKINVRTS